jgi:peptidyl-prolyl cis-trans isomerase D
MTMLDRMRRHKGWLKWSLALVCLAFVVFYIPDFLQTTGTGAAPTDVVAEVDGRRITAGEFDRIYRAQVQAYQGAYGGSASVQLLRQLGLDRQILQQLIDEEAALVEAARLGIGASDAEVRARIVSLPIFQENGVFVGEARYREFLRIQRPPMTTADFEERVRRGTIVEKLRAAVTSWVSVPDGVLDREYGRRNEKVKLAVVAFPVEKFTSTVTATDGEIDAYFKEHQEEYRVPEKRKVKYVTIDVQSLREPITVAERDVERAYNDQIDQHSTPEQVRARHILLKTDAPGADEAAVRKRAEDILTQVKGGADFAALATKYSEDEGSAKQGGDLSFFERGRMVPEFDAAAFSLAPGQVSDLVKTSFGFHIIKVEEKRAAATKSLDEVKQQIVDQIKWERAQTQADQMARAMDAEIDDPADLDRVAAARGLKAAESGLFARNEPVAGLGFSPEAAAVAFELADGQVSPAIRTPQGYGFITVTGRADAYLPKLEDVRDQVREAVVRGKAIEAGKQKASELAASLKTAKDFAQEVKAAGVEAKSSELVARGAALPDVGISPAVDAVAFSLPAGAVSDPIQTDAGMVIVKVLERQDVDAAALAAARPTLRQELVAEQRNLFFASYMAKAKQRMRIQIDTETLQKIVV